MDNDSIDSEGRSLPNSEASSESENSNDENEIIDEDEDDS